MNAMVVQGASSQVEVDALTSHESALSKRL